MQYFDRIIFILERVLDEDDGWRLPARGGRSSGEGLAGTPASVCRMGSKKSPENDTLAGFSWDGIPHIPYAGERPRSSAER